jgi:tetratricopeptide (TPR) repeat protein
MSHRACGPGEDTLRTAKSLAVSLRKLGSVDEAYELTMETQDRCARKYSPDHPEALACLLNLVCDLSARDDKSAAMEQASAVLVVYREELGPAHPCSLVALNNIPTYQRELGLFEEALRTAEDALTEMRTKLGDDHPFTLSCAINKANCLRDAGDFDAAGSLQRDTLEACRRPWARITQTRLSVRATMRVHCAPMAGARKPLRCKRG